MKQYFIRERKSKIVIYDGLYQYSDAEKKIEEFEEEDKEEGNYTPDFYEVVEDELKFGFENNIVDVVVDGNIINNVVGHLKEITNNTICWYPPSYTDALEGYAKEEGFLEALVYELIKYKNEKGYKYLAVAYDLPYAPKELQQDPGFIARNYAEKLGQLGFHTKPKDSRYMVIKENMKRNEND